MPTLQNGNWITGINVNTKLNHVENWPVLAQRAQWSVSSLAKQCGVSVRTLERYFISKMGRRPKAWLIDQRQRMAVKLLLDGNSVKETASYLNFKHPSHLTNGFKKSWGRCPTADAVHLRAKHQ